VQGSGETRPSFGFERIPSLHRPCPILTARIREPSAALLPIRRSRRILLVCLKLRLGRSWAPVRGNLLH
jgi:hypothetical protein